MTQIHNFSVGPLLMRVENSGIAVPLIGNYETSRAVETPDVIVRVELSEKFAEGREPRENYPAFTTERIGAHAISLSRLDAEGNIDFSPDQPVIANLRGHAGPHTLEAAIRVAASIALPRKDALIMHSSAIRDQNGAHMFSGVSGRGKSTIAALLCAHYPVQKLSDELLLLVRQDGYWHVQVSPFSGKEDLPRGVSSPLRSIDFLVQAPENCRSRLAPSAAMRELPKHVVSYAQDPTTLASVLDLLADLVESIPCYRLEFEKSPSVGDTIHLTCS